MPSSRASSQPRDWTQFSHIAGGFFTSWVTICNHNTGSSVLKEVGIWETITSDHKNCLWFKVTNHPLEWGTCTCQGARGFVVQLLSYVWLFATPRTVTRHASVSQSLFKLMSTETMMPSNHLILYHFLLLLPSIFPHTGVFSNELALHIRQPMYWSFSLKPPVYLCSLTWVIGLKMLI